MASNKDIFGKNLEGAITSDDILGKEVIDTDGNFIGVIEKVFFDKKSLDFAGIAVDKGILKKGLTIGKGYIERVAEHAVFLNVSVAFELKGLTVFDVSGKEIGVVENIGLKGTTNIIEYLEIKGDKGKSLFIPSSYILSIGNNIILGIKESDIR